MKAFLNACFVLFFFVCATAASSSSQELPPKGLYGLTSEGQGQLVFIDPTTGLTKPVGPPLSGISFTEFLIGALDTKQLQIYTIGGVQGDDPSLYLFSVFLSNGSLASKTRLFVCTSSSSGSQSLHYNQRQNLLYYIASCIDSDYQIFKIDPISKDVSYVATIEKFPGSSMPDPVAFGVDSISGLGFMTGADSNYNILIAGINMTDGSRKWMMKDPGGFTTNFVFAGGVTKSGYTMIGLSSPPYVNHSEIVYWVNSSGKSSKSMEYIKNYDFPKSNVAVKMISGNAEKNFYYMVFRTNDQLHYSLLTLMITSEGTQIVDTVKVASTSINLHYYN